MILADLPIGYYAVPDPDAPQILVVCHRGTSQKNGGPKVRLTRQVPKDLLYAPPSRGTSRDRVERMAWLAEVTQALLANPEQARKCYSDKTCRCWACGQKLTDPLSIQLGIGPVCRDALGLTTDTSKIELSGLSSPPPIADSEIGGPNAEHR